MATSLLRPHYYGRLVVTATSLRWPARYYGHLIMATSLLRPPHYYSHLITCTSMLLLWPSRYYGHFILTWTKAQPAILFKESLQYDHSVIQLYFCHSLVMRFMRFHHSFYDMQCLCYPKFEGCLSCLHLTYLVLTHLVRDIFCWRCPVLYCVSRGKVLSIN